MIEYEITGLKSLNKTLNKIIKNLSIVVEKGIQEALQGMADFAIIQAPSETGKLKESIKYELLNVNTGEIEGRVYADVNIAPYALWVNYGTGIYAEGEGGSRAKRIPWFVHESMADLSRYNFQRWYAPTGDMFYIVYGQKATHFFDSISFIKRDDSVKAVAKQIEELIRRHGDVT